MTFRSYRTESENNWGTSEEGALSLEQINTGAILRIADATEKMCLDRETLERECKYMRESRDRYRDLYESEKRRAAALRGVITRMKRAVDSAGEGE